MLCCVYFDRTRGMGKAWHASVFPTAVRVYKPQDLEASLRMLILCYNECHEPDLESLHAMATRAEELDAVVVNHPRHQPSVASKWSLFQTLGEKWMAPHYECAEQVQHWPCIAADPLGAGGQKRLLLEAPFAQKTPQHYIYITYVDSQRFGHHFAARLLTVGTRLLYAFPRFGATWNVGTEDETIDASLLEKGFEELAKHKSTLHAITELLGRTFPNCCLVTDLIFDRNDRVLICETGFKFAPDRFLKKLSAAKLCGRGANFPSSSEIYERVHNALCAVQLTAES